VAEENLGKAVLRIEVDIPSFEKDLNKVRSLVEKQQALVIEVKGANQAQTELRNISTEADRSATRVRTLNQLINDIPGGSYSKISAQIQKLSTQSRDLTLQTEQYVKVLQRVRELELIRSKKVGRSTVQADFQAQQRFIAGEKASNFVPEIALPNTTAADIQLIRELTQRLQNVDRASGDYEVTLRQLEQAQRRVSEAISGRSSTYRQLQAQEEAAIRRAEKLAGIQAYYSGMNPRAGGVRSESGAILARGSNSVADERAYNAALRPAKELLDLDLKREQTLRRISQRILATAEANKGGFGEFSQIISAPDPVAKSIRRNQEKRDRAEQQRISKLDILDADLARVRETRLRVEREKLVADKAEAQATKDAAVKAKKLADAKARRDKDILGNAIIGGAFPLLFGQGIGASIGGAAGGAAGGAIGGQFGFGLSLVGTGLGASFDALIARSKELAEALRDPIASFDQLKAASVLSSRGLETYIEALIKTGQTAKAEQLIRADLTQNINPTTAAALSQTNDELARSFSDVQEKLSALVAGPAIAFLQWLDDIIDRLPIRGPAGAAAGQLPTAQQAQAQVDRGVGVKSAGIATIVAGILAGAVVGGPAGALIGGVYSGIGAGVTTFGQGQIAQGEQAQDDLATQRATAGIQEEIAAIQARRLAIQKQLVAFTGNENSAGAQITQAQNTVLAAQEAILKARKEYIATPVGSTAAEEAVAFDAYKNAVEAARLEVEKLIAANNNQAANLKRTTDIRERTTGFTASARQGAVLAEAAARARQDYDKAKAATASATGDDAVAAAQSIENVLGQAWRSAAQNLTDYNAELAFTAERQAQINKLAADKVAEDLKAVQAQRLLIQSAQRTAQFAVQQSTLTQVQGIEAAVRAARQRESDLGDQITAARQRGDETLATDLVAQQKIAANQTRLELEQGALALRNAGIKLREDVEAAFLNFQKVQADPNGLRQYLTPQDRANQDQQLFESLLPSFRTAQEQFKRLRNVNYAPEFTGPTAGVNQAILQFIDQVNLAQKASDTVNDTQAALNTNTEALVKTTGELAAKIDELNQKDWAVNVQVNGAGTSQITGDVLPTSL
jgi:hypothetical protein